MSANSSINSSDSHVFNVEQLSDEPNPPRNNTPEVLNSTELSGVHPRKAITISAVASPGARIITINSDSNDPTMPYGYRRQNPIIPPSMNDLNLPPNPFDKLATMALIQADSNSNDKNYNPPSPELSEPSPISTPLMNLSMIDGWKYPHTTTEDITFYWEDEPGRSFWEMLSNETFYSYEEPRRIVLQRCSPTTPLPPKHKRRLSMGMSFRKGGGVSQQDCKACGFVLPTENDIPVPSTKKLTLKKQ